MLTQTQYLLKTHMTLETVAPAKVHTVERLYSFSRNLKAKCVVSLYAPTFGQIYRLNDTDKEDLSQLLNTFSPFSLATVVLEMRNII